MFLTNFSLQITNDSDTDMIGKKFAIQAAIGANGRIFLNSSENSLTLDISELLLSSPRNQT